MKKVFVFDLDDTLYWNKHDYCYAILKFEKFLLHTWGRRAPYIMVINQLFCQIDRDRVPYYGYSMERFPGSMVKCYEEICQHEGIPFDDKIAKQIETIGYGAFSEKNYRRKGLVKGAKEVLTFLKKQGDTLILLTKGDERVQRSKISVLKLGQWFDEIYIELTSKIETFKRIAGEQNADKIWSVGNSFKSDIKPALGAGLKGIYIPYETWESKGEKERVLKTLDRSLVLVFNEIIEIKKNYRRIL